MERKNSMKKYNILFCFIIIIVITVLTIIMSSVIEISSVIEKKYEWSAVVSAPREYPIEVYTGAAGDYFFSQMGGFSNVGWGGGGIDNTIEAPLPDRLDMTWLSYVDNKFYTGEWELPTEKIQQLFDQGYYSGPIEPGVDGEIYNNIQIGLAPKGMVVVWVCGSGSSNQVEVARFQAHETTINPKLLTEDEKYMFEKDYAKDMLTYDGTISKDLREQLRLHGFPPPEVYEAYREKYLWKPKVILPEGCRINSLSIKMCNGEMENPFDKPVEQKQRAIPYVFEIFWYVGTGKNQREFVSKIAFTGDLEYWEKSHFDNGFNGIPVDFDKNQIRTLFKEHIDSNKNTELVIKIDPMKENNRDWSVQIFLEQSGKKYIINQIDHNSGIYD
jgi:hypothetical protein